MIPFVDIREKDIIILMIYLKNEWKKSVDMKSLRYLASLLLFIILTCRFN